MGNETENKRMDMQITFDLIFESWTGNGGSHAIGDGGGRDHGDFAGSFSPWTFSILFMCGFYNRMPCIRYDAKPNRIDWGKN